jgi:hypothetical protein
MIILCWLTPTAGRTKSYRQRRYYYYPGFQAPPTVQQAQQVEFFSDAHARPPCCCVFEFHSKIQNSNHPTSHSCRTTKMATNKQGIKEYHPAILFNGYCGKGKKKLEASERFTLCFDFVAEVSQRETCVDRLSGKRCSRTCECLSILQDNAARQAAVARYMYDFIARPHQERHSIVTEWIRYTAHTQQIWTCAFLFLSFPTTTTKPRAKLATTILSIHSRNGGFAKMPSLFYWTMATDLPRGNFAEQTADS